MSRQARPLTCPVKGTRLRRFGRPKSGSPGPRTRTRLSPPASTGTGTLDLAAVSNGSGALDVPDNNGDSNVDSVAVHTNAGVTLVTTLTAEGAHDAAVADLAPDGTADIAVAASGAGRAAVFQGSCS